MKIIVRNLSHRDIQELKEAFLKIDRDNSGYITAEELAAALDLNNIRDIDKS